MKEEKIIIIGAGGHARVLLDALQQSRVEVAGLTDQNYNGLGFTDVFGVPVLGDDSVVFGISPGSVYLVNGLAGVRSTLSRKEVFEKFKAAKYSFRQVIHPSVVRAGHCELGEGVQAMAGAVVQTGSSVGDNTLINTRASVDHDCRVGAHVHIAPGVTLSGGVTVGDGAHIGTGASVIQGVRIGAGSLVAAGAVVVSDVPAGARVMGVPAKQISE